LKGEIMAFNKTEMANMRAMDREFRFAWVRGLDKIKGTSVIAALAQMLEIDDTWEFALTFLDKRKGKYPKPVSQQVLYALKRSDDVRRYEKGLYVLKGIHKADLEAAMVSVRMVVDSCRGDEWDKFLRKVLRDLRKI
jgi:hypothetical protein